jgi:hypothetical protein
MELKAHMALTVRRQKYRGVIELTAMIWTGNRVQMRRRGDFKCRGYKSLLLIVGLDARTKGPSPLVGESDVSPENELSPKLRVLLLKFWIQIFCYNI